MNNGPTFLLNNVASAVLGDESEECHTETDLTLHSHPQHETSYLFTQSSPSERLCEVSVKCDVSCLQDTLSGVYDVELQAFNTTFRDWKKKICYKNSSRCRAVAFIFQSIHMHID